MGTRRRAREVALQFLYQLDLQGEDDPVPHEQEFWARHALSGEARTFTEKEDGPEDAGLALGAVVFQADIPLADVLGINVDGAAGDGILAMAHGPLLVKTWWYKSLSGGALRSSRPSLTPTGRTGIY